MKKINKVLSSILAASMILSCFAMNVFADSKQHTLTVDASKKEALAKGETIVVTVSVDNTEAIDTLEYKLVYDSNAFELDTTKIGRDPENYIDKTWLNAIKNTDGNWGYYFGTPVYSPTSTVVGVLGEIYMGYASSGVGVESDYAENNLVVGKFNVKVKSDAADGTYTFSLKADSNTRVFGEVLPTPVASVPVTVTVGEPAPAGPTFTDDTQKVEGLTANKTYTDGSYNIGVKADAIVVPAGSNATKIKFSFTTDDANKTTKTAVAEYVLPTTVEAGGVSVALNVTSIPAGVTLTYNGATVE